MNSTQKEIIKKEGLVSIHYPESQSVFYNPAQVFNRDLSIIAIKAFSNLCKRALVEKEINSRKRAKDDGRQEPLPLEFRGFNILEPLSASGLRSLRYIKELEDTVFHVTANDLDPNAVENIIKNSERNDIPHSKITVMCGDAASLMYLAKVYQGNNSKSTRLLNITAGATFHSKIDQKPDKKEDINEPKNEAGIRLDQLIPPFKTENLDQPFKEEIQMMLYDIIDIDPYGTVSPFLDSAVQAIRSGGMLCLTSTDMPVLCGNMPEVSFYKYGGFPSKASYMHELSLRLLMNAVSMSAAKYKRVAIPLACCSVDFYVRIFVQIQYNPEGCKKLPQNTSLASQCNSCNFFELFPMGQCQLKKKTNSIKYRASIVPENIGKCEECGSACSIVGPFYSGPLFDQIFLDECLSICDNNTLNGLTMIPKIKGLFTAMKQELPDVCLHYNIPAMFYNLSLSMLKPAILKSALKKLGYRATHFHRDPDSLKTDAPSYVVYDILRFYAQSHPPKNYKDSIILNKPLRTREPIDLNYNPDEKPDSSVPRWLPNPQKFWGPISKARSKRTYEESSIPPKTIDSSIRNDNENPLLS